MIATGDKVGYDACTGDTIQVKDNEGELHTVKVVDSYPNQVRIAVANGDTYLILYRDLLVRGATYVSLRQKAIL